MDQGPQRQARGRPRNPVRTVARILGILVALVIVLVIGLAAFSQTDTFRDWLRRQVVARANAALNGRVEIGRLEGNLFGFFMIRDLTVTLEGEPVLSVGRARAAYELLPLLLEQRVLIDEVTLENVRARLVGSEAGWNVANLLPEAKEPEGPDAPEEAGELWPVTLDELTLEDGRLDVVLPDAEYRLREISLRASADIDREGREIDVQTLTFRMPERNLELKELAAELRLAADGSLAADDLVLETGASRLAGHARKSVEEDGALYDLDLRLDLEAAEVERALGRRLLASDISATVLAHGPAERLSVDGTQIQSSSAGSLRLDGTLDLAQQKTGYDLQIRLANLDASGFLGPDQPVTDLNGTIEAEGAGTTLEEAVAEVALVLADSSFRGTRIDELEVEGSVQRQAISFAAAVRLPEGQANALGEVDLSAERYDLQIRAQQFDAAPFLGRDDLETRINVRATVQGSGFSAQTANAQAEMHMEGSQLGPVGVRDLDARLGLADQQLTIEHLRVDSDAAQANVSGSIGLAEALRASAAEQAEAELRYEVRATDLDRLARLAGAGPAQGQLEIAGTASGSLRSLDLDATLTAQGLARDTTKIDRLSARIDASDLGGVRAEAAVSARVEGLAFSGRRLEELQLEGEWEKRETGPARAVLSAEGRGEAEQRYVLRATADLGETKEVWIERLRFDLRDQTWASTGRPHLLVRDQRLSIRDLALRSEQGSIVLEGETGTSGAQDLRLVIERFELAAVTAGPDEVLTGTLSGQAHLGGTAQSPRLQAELTVDRPAIQQVKYERADLSLLMAQGEAAIDARLVQDDEQGRRLTFDGRLPVDFSLAPFRLETGDDLSASLQASTIDLTFLDPLIPQVNDLGGVLNADLTIGGSLREPELRGPISIENGRAHVVPTGLRYDPIELRMQIDRRALRIERVYIASGGGSITGSGTGELGEAAAGEITLELDEFPLFGNEYGDAVASGWMWIGGTADAPIIEGGLETERMVLRIPEQLPGAVRPLDPTIQVIGPDVSPWLAEQQQVEAAADVPEGEEEELPKPDLWERAAIRIQLHVPHNAWLRRSDANIELRGWMTVWKKPGNELHVAGEINTVRGWYSFQGKKFEVVEGQVTFSGQEFNPRLDVVAEHQAGEYTVRVNIGGTITEPTIELESDPFLDQADILSVLVFGKPVSELNQGQADGLRQQALGVASGYVASQLRQSVANALGLDNLEITPGTEGLAGASVTVGKYITEDVFVSLSNMFAAQSVQELQIEYFITPQWILQTTMDTLGTSGVDLFWRWRY